MFNRFHQLLRSSVAGTAFCLLPALAALPAQVQAPATAALIAPTGNASVDVVVLEVTGTVQASTDDGKTWTPAKAGLHVRQGSWFRTGFRSSVTCGTTGHRVFTLESLSAIRVDAAILNGRHYKTDLVNHGALRVGMTSESVTVKIKTPDQSEQRGDEQGVRLAVDHTPIAAGAGPSHRPDWKKGLAWFLCTVLAGMSGCWLRYAGTFRCLHAS